MLKFAVCLSLFGLTLVAQPVLPEGTGREETEKLCKGCHEVARSISLRQDRNGWMNTMTKMTAFGMKASEHDVNVVVDYLYKNFPADELPPINVNKAAAIQMESGLGLKRSQVSALIAYRTEHGPFKTLDDLKKVPGIDPAKFDAKKDRITF